MKLDEKHLEILKLWCEVEDVSVVDFKMYDHDRGGVYIKNLYKVFSDNRNPNTHIVFTSPDIIIKEGTYNIKELTMPCGGKKKRK